MGGEHQYYPGGGGYGGQGGNSYNDYAAGGAEYGSITEPDQMGSGGGKNTAYNKAGGAGGGAIKLTVGGTLHHQGSISADGANGETYNSNYGGGGGSGGSIWISAGAVTGSGSLSANGGNSGGSYAGGGGGGRVALFYFTSDLSILDLYNFTVNGGSGYNDGEAGTIYVSQVPNPWITTNDGLNFVTSTPSLILEGTCLSVINQILVNGSPDGVDYTSGETTWRKTVDLQEGLNTFDVVAMDTEGRASGKSIIVITLDTTPEDAPVITTNSGGDLSTQYVHFVLEGTCAETVTAINVNDSAYGVTYVPGSGIWSFSVDMEMGPNQFSVTALDESGNRSPADTITITFENTLVSRPVNVSPSDNATGILPEVLLSASAFADGDTGDTHIVSQWQLRGETDNYDAALFDSGEDEDHLTEILIPYGTLELNKRYYWRVRYKESRGVWSPYSEETAFTTLLDTTPPETNIHAGPAHGALVYVNQAGFAWTASDNVPWDLTYATQLDDGPWSEFGTAKSIHYTQLTDGPHTFRVKARDKSLNEDSTPVERVFTVLTAPEDVTRLTVASSDTSLVFAWVPSANTLGDLAGYKVYFNGDPDGVVLGAEENSYTATGLTPATAYAFKVTTFDNLGHESPGRSTTGVTLLSNPANIIARPYSGYVDLTWDPVPAAEHVKYYAVYVQDNDFTTVSGLTPKLTTHSTAGKVAGLVNNRTYYIAVTAVNLSGGERQEVSTIAVTPVPDSVGPELTDAVMNGMALVDGSVMTQSAAVSLKAADPAGVSRVELFVDNVFYATSLSGSGTYTFNLDIATLTDGDHTMTFTAYDTLGNSQTMSFNFSVALGLPQAPVIGAPATGGLVNKSVITVSGQAGQNEEVAVFRGIALAGGWSPVDSRGRFSLSATLSEGENTLQARARNRAGEGPPSTAVTITLDTGIPDSPTHLEATPAASGVIRLTWRKPLDASIKGYNLYRSDAAFETAGLAAKVNTSLLLTTTYNDLPATDGKYFYRVSAVDHADNESALSNLVSATSDSVLPEAVSIQYAPTGAYDPTTGRMGPGLVNLTLTVSEPLLTTPFLSINPVGAVPLTVNLKRQSELIYTGWFVIDSATPTGMAYAVFSARDVAGNRGDAITAGGTVAIDTDGPHLIDIKIQPQAPIKNDETAPVEITVVLGLNEAVKAGDTPDLSYLLSGSGRSPVSIDAVQRVATAGGHAETWQAIFTLPADAGLNQAETLEFIYSAVDDLDNFSDRVKAANAFQVYQGNLPPLEVPTGLQGVSLPAGRIRLSWNPVAQAVGYVLYRQAPGESELSPLISLGAVSEYTDAPSVEGTYYYAIASVRSENGQQAESGMSAPIDVASDATAPGIPADLSLTLTARGIQAVWTAPAYTETITYSLYRSAAADITSTEGLTPVLTGIDGTTATDAHPSETDHCYVVTAVDGAGNESAPSNSFYLNFELLPVGELTVVKVDEERPVISWAHSGGGTIGYDIYLGPEGSTTQLNTGRLTESTYTDSGCDGNERRFTVVALDEHDRESLGRSIVLPMARADLSDTATLKRGLMNRLEYAVSNSGSTAIGQARLRVTVEGKEHVSETFGVSAGASHVVPVVVGGYSDLPGTASLTTSIEITPNAGEMVRIENNRDIDVGAGMLSLTFTNNELVRGASGEIVFTLENTGDEEIEIVTAEPGGRASADITLYLSDAEGNILSTGSYAQTLGSNVVTLSKGRTVARIAPGAVFQSQPMSIAVPAGAPDDVELILEIGSIYYRQGTPEAVVMDGVRTRRDISLIDTAFYGGIISISPESSNGDQDIEIVGRAMDRATGQPLPEVPLKLVITLEGFERSIDVFTGSNGRFTYTFAPPDGEFGDYRVCAVHPDLKDRPVQGRFSITPIGSSQIAFSPCTYQLTTVRNYKQEIVITVAAGEAAEATNLRFAYEAADQDGGVLPQGIHVDTGDVLSMLASGATATMPINLWADNTADEDTSLVLRLISDETPGGDWGTVTIHVHFTTASPVLAYTPNHMETGLALGETVTETLALENKGFAPLTEVAVELVNSDGSAAPAWARVSLPSDMEAIDVGETRDVTLQLSPTESNAAEGEYDFYVRVGGSNYTVTNILVHVCVTQSGIGKILFKVSDIYTATIDPESGELIQGLAGAKLRLQNEQVPTREFSGTTDSYGEFFLSDIPAGRYKYRLAADNHQEVIGRIWIKPGITITEDVFMGYNLVTVEWSVIETTIQDQYEIVLSATYETDVPAAVVIAEPKSITLPDMEPGDVFVGEIRFTNHGLIRADDIRFALPDSNQYFKYEFLANIPDSIEAKGSITVPYRVTCLASLTGEDDGAGGCVTHYDRSCLWYLYKCSNGTTYESVECVVFTKVFGECPGGPGTPASGGGSGGGGGGIGGGGGWSGGSGSGGGSGWSGGSDGGGGYSPPPEVPEGVVCKPAAVCEVNDECCKAEARQSAGSYVDLRNGSYEDDTVDLSLKIPGTYLKVKRYYYDHAWHFNNIASGLQFHYGTHGAIPVSILKDGVEYEKSDSSGTVFSFNKTKNIFKEEDGYIWKDRSGNWIQYNLSGKILSQGRYNLTAYTYVYDTLEPDRITQIQDKNGTAVLWYDYDEDGHIIAVRDGNGRGVSYAYTNGSLTRVTDVLGHEITYIYDADGRMTSKTDQEGRTTAMEYNSFGWVSAIIDDQGDRTEFRYSQDSAKNESYNQIIFPNGRVKETWYDDKGRVIRIDMNGSTMEENIYENRKRYKSDAYGNRTIYELNEWDQVVRKTYPDGTIEETAYDPVSKQKIKQIEKNGTVTIYEYDDNGNLIRQVLAKGSSDEVIYEFTYDDDNSMLTRKIAGDEDTIESVTTITYDDYGNMASETDPEGNTTYYTYNYMGLLLAQEDPRGYTWAYTYDDVGNMITQTDPLGHTTTYSYDAVGNQTLFTDASGNVYQYTFDHKDRLISQTDPLGNTTTNELNVDGKVVKRIDPEGKKLHFEYNNEGQLLKVTDGNGNVIEAEYENGVTIGCSSCSGGGSSQPSKVIFPTFSKAYTYDVLGRKIAEEDILSSSETYTTSFEYDFAGNLIAETDKESNVTSYEYDALNRLTKVIDSMGGETVYAYDDRNNLLSLKDAGGHTTLFEYDRNNRLVKETRPMGEETSYAYDSMGNLVQKIDPKNQKTVYIYDEAERLVTVQYYAVSTDTDAAKTVTFTYDNARNLKSFDDGVTSATYDYDASYRKTGETVNYGPFSLENNYTYYRNGLKASYTGPDAVTYGYRYDANNQLSTVRIPNAGYVTIGEYQLNRPKNMTLPGGNKKEFEYDPLMRVEQITDIDPAENLLASYAYTYDRMDNITAKSTEHGDYTYGYDDLYRITDVDNVMLVDEAFTYDAIGNRLTSAVPPTDWTYNENNELTGYDAVTFEYDLNGNMVEKNAGGVVMRYFYNIENRLERVEDGLGSVIAEYYYDPFGRRLWKDVSGVRTYYHYSYEGLVGEYNASGTVIKTYGYYPDSIWTTNPIFMKVGAEYYFYHNDHLGSPEKLTRMNGAVVWSTTYTSFGEASVGGEAIDNKLRFPGQYYDAETKMYYNFHRYYDPGLGRYNRPDPIGLAGGINQYSYVSNNPISVIDSLGLFLNNFVWHGNWGGPGWSSKKHKAERDLSWEDFLTPAKDRRDECYKGHDICIWDCYQENVCPEPISDCIENCDHLLGYCLSAIPPWAPEFWITPIEDFGSGHNFILPGNTLFEALAFHTVVPLIH
ncbi:MAG: RHS repeat-associated core domain-containing protein [Pseudomonadota bacterium]